MTALLETGEQIAIALRAAAAERKLPLLQFIRPLSAQPSSWLKQVQMARLPTRRTRDRVRALLAGEPLPRSIDPNPLRERPAPRRRKAPRADGRSLTMTIARQRLRDQLGSMTRTGQSWRTTSIMLTCNIRYTVSGARDQKLSKRDPEDPGVALYFDLDGRPHVLACDRWDTVQDNIAAIAAHIEALRGQERWGVADMTQAFAGHMALPRPSSWWEVLGVAADATIDNINAAYRAAAKTAHPNAGGDRAAWDRLSAAYEEAKQQRDRT